MITKTDIKPDAPGTSPILGEAFEGAFGELFCAASGPRLRRALSPFGALRQGTSLSAAGYHALKIDGRFAAINPSAPVTETSAMGAPSGTRAWSPPV